MPQSAQISCYCCKKSGEDNKFVTCWLCKHVFYYTCVELSLSDIKAIKNKSNINFTCETCKETAVTLADLKALVISLQEEVKELKANKHTIADQLSSSMDYEEIIQEIQDRNSRKKNLIIYGLPENNEQPVAQRRTLDKENIKKMDEATGIDLGRLPWCCWETNRWRRRPGKAVRRAFMRYAHAYAISTERGREVDENQTSELLLVIGIICIIIGRTLEL
nr:unnamed protein product [Callosobruchus chinensis]